jgi:hypothetical protein
LTGAITEVTKAVTADTTLNSATRMKVLDLLLELARQTALPAAQRSPTVGRTVMGALDTALSAAGNLADVWSAWGPTIKAFFGISD